MLDIKWTLSGESSTGIEVSSASIKQIHPGIPHCLHTHTYMPFGFLSNQLYHLTYFLTNYWVKLNLSHVCIFVCDCLFLFFFFKPYSLNSASKKRYSTHRATCCLDAIQRWPTILSVSPWKKKWSLIESLTHFPPLRKQILKQRPQETEDHRGWTKFTAPFCTQRYKIQ